MQMCQFCSGLTRSVCVHPVEGGICGVPICTRCGQRKFWNEHSYLCLRHRRWRNKHGFNIAICKAMPKAQETRNFIYVNRAEQGYEAHPLANNFIRQNEEWRNYQFYRSWLYNSLMQKNPSAVMAANQLVHLAETEGLFMGCWCIVQPRYEPKDMRHVFCHAEVIANSLLWWKEYSSRIVAPPKEIIYTTKVRF